MAAALGLDATGVDIAPTALAIAKRKATERGLTARFLAWDATDLAALGERWQTVLDSGVFHVFDDTDRPRYVASLAAAVEPGGRYHMLVFSDRQSGTLGPRRISQAEIRAAFADGWSILQHRAGDPRDERRLRVERWCGRRSPRPSLVPVLAPTAASMARRHGWP